MHCYLPDTALGKSTDVLVCLEMNLPHGYRNAVTVLATPALVTLCSLSGCGRTSIHGGDVDRATGIAASSGSPAVAGSSPGGPSGAGGSAAGAAGMAGGGTGNAAGSGHAGAAGGPLTGNCGGLRCDPHAYCDRSRGAPRCVCIPGYVGDGIQCEDEDECATGTAECAPEADCINREGSYDCVCRDGYAGDGFECMDINECAEGTDDCSEHATCTNQPGSYTCTCDPPYVGDGVVCAIDCPDADLGSTVPQRHAGTTLGRVDFFTSSCGAVPGSPDYSAVFTPELTGEYVFQTVTSQFDTVLSVLQGECGSIELGCDDDTIQYFSWVAVELLAGDTVTAVVDGADGAAGDFMLRVDRVACPNRRLSEAPTTIQDTTEGHESFHTTSCGGAWTAPDFTLVFTAPVTRRFTFDTVGSDYDTVLTLLAGSCEGNELACDDDSHGLQSELSANLDAGESVTVVVTGYAGAYGPFVLNVT